MVHYYHNKALATDFSYKTDRVAALGAADVLLPRCPVYRSPRGFCGMSFCLIAQCSFSFCFMFFFSVDFFSLFVF